VRVAAGRASSVKMGDDGGGLLISPDGVAPSQIVGVSAYVIFPCTIKVQKILLAPAHLGSPGKRAVKQLCVCVCVTCCRVDFITSPKLSHTFTPFQQPFSR